MCVYMHIYIYIYIHRYTDIHYTILTLLYLYYREEATPLAIGERTKERRPSPTRTCLSTPPRPLMIHRLPNGVRTNVFCLRKCRNIP